MSLKLRWETEFKKTELGFEIPLEWKGLKIEKAGEVVIIK